MAGFFGFLAFVSFIFLVLSIFKPALVQSILKREFTRSRGIKYFGGGLLGLLVLAGVFTPSVSVESDKIQGVATENQIESSASPSVTPSLEPVPSPSEIPSPTPQPSAAASITPSPTVKPTPKPTVTPTPKPSVAAKPIVIPTPTIAPTPASTIAPAPQLTSADKDCKDFSSHSEAQAYFNSKGGSASNNVDDLDRDHDGLACESL